jgi:hypothetical protein
MKSNLRQFIGIIAFFSLVLFLVGCKSDEMKKFSDVSKGLAKNLNELRGHPGIIMTDFSADGDKKVIKLGIGIEPNKITSEEVKKDVDLYLKHSASFTSAKEDYNKLLQPYTLRIERIGLSSTDFPLLAEKPSGSTD